MGNDAKNNNFTIYHGKRHLTFLQEITSYRTLSLNIYGWRNFFLDKDIKKEDIITFLSQGTGCMSWSLIIALPIERKIKLFSRPINAPKWRRSAVNGGNMAISKLWYVCELGCAFKLNCAKYKINFKKSKYLDFCLIYRKPLLNFKVSTLYVPK